MANDLYKQVQQKLDLVGCGFPKTMVGLEKVFLKKLYSPEDAEVFLGMHDRGRFITAADYAEKNGVDEAWAEEKLYDMSTRGIIYRQVRDGVREYAHYPFAFGLMEFQIERDDRSWLPSAGAYAAVSKFSKKMHDTMPFYRTIPVRREMVVGSEVLPYDDLDALLDRHDRFQVAQCMCRTMKKGCDHPTETCIMTDDMADFYNENGWGHSISRDEAKAILREGEKDGRIIQVGNTRNAENLCSCCGCGCAMMQLGKRVGSPASKLWSNYRLVYDADACVGCGKCVERCTFKYVKCVGEKVETNMDGCLACGLCVSTCPTGARILERKPDDEVYLPPETLNDAYQMWYDVRQGTVKVPMASSSWSS